MDVAICCCYTAFFYVPSHNSNCLHFNVWLSKDLFHFKSILNPNYYYGRISHSPWIYVCNIERNYVTPAFKSCSSV